MKKKKMIFMFSIVAVIVLGIILALLLRPAKIAQTISLDKQPLANEQTYKPIDKNKYAFAINVPSDGRIKISIIDATGNIEKSKKIELSAIVKDSDNKTVAEKICGANQVCIIDTPIKKGSYTVNIKFKNPSQEVQTVGISWAYASKKASDDVKIDGPIATTLIDNNGIAKFSVNAEKHTLVEISGGDAGNPECFYTFSVEDEKGQKIVDDTKIHETEWFSRKVFLPVGKYTITMTELTKNSVAECKLKSVEDFENISSSSFSKKTATEIKNDTPVCLGFTNNMNAEQWFRISCDGKFDELLISVSGNNTYYDMVSSAKFSIIDSNNNVVKDVKAAESFNYNISKLRGTYYILVIPNGNNNMVVKAQLK